MRLSVCFLGDEIFPKRIPLKQILLRVDPIHKGCKIENGRVAAPNMYPFTLKAHCSMK